MTPREDGYYCANLSNTESVYIRFLVEKNECRFTVINRLSDTEEDALEYLGDRAMSALGGNCSCRFLNFDIFEVYESREGRDGDIVIISGKVRKMYVEGDSMSLRFPDEDGYSEDPVPGMFFSHDFSQAPPAAEQ